MKSVLFSLALLVMFSGQASAAGIDDIKHEASLGTGCGWYWYFTVSGQDYAFRPADNFVMGFLVQEYTAGCAAMSLSLTATTLQSKGTMWNALEPKCPDIHAAAVTGTYGWPNSAQGALWMTPTDMNANFGETATALTAHDPNQYRQESVLIVLNQGAGVWALGGSGSVSLAYAISHELGHCSGLLDTYDQFGFERMGSDCQYHSVMSQNYDNSFFSPTAEDGESVVALYKDTKTQTAVWSALLSNYGAFGSTAYLQTVAEEHCQSIVLRGFASTGAYPSSPETLGVIAPHGGYGMTAQYVVSSVPSRSLYDWVVVDSLGPSKYSEPFASTSEPSDWDSIYAVASTDIDSAAEPESLEAASSEWTGGTLAAGDSTLCADFIVYSFADSMANPVYNQIGNANPGKRVVKVLASGSPPDLSANECRRQLNVVWQNNAHWNDLWSASTHRVFPVTPGPEVYIVGVYNYPAMAIPGVGMASLPDTANYCGHPDCRSDLLIYDLNGDGLPEGPLSRVYARNVQDCVRITTAAADFDSMRYVESAGHVLVCTDDANHEYNSSVASDIATRYALSGFPVRPLLKASAYPVLVDRLPAFATQVNAGTREVFGLDGETGMFKLPGWFQYGSYLNASARQRIIGWFPDCNIHGMWQSGIYSNGIEELPNWMRNDPAHSMLAASVAHMDIGRGANHMLGAQYLAAARMAVPASDRQTSVARVLYNAVIAAAAAQPRLRDHMLCLSAIGSYVRVNPAFPSGGGGGGCPIAESMTHDGWVAENTVLSRSATGELASDGLKLLAPIAMGGGKYRVRLRENEQERTTLDAVALATLDRDRSVQSYKTASGYVYGIRRSAAHAWLASGRDVTAFVSGESDSGLVLNPGDTLYVDWANPRGVGGIATMSSDGRPIVTEDDSLFDLESMSKELPPDEELSRGVRLESSLDQRILAGTGLQIQKEAAQGDWVTVNQYHPRALFEEAVTAGVGTGKLRIVAIGRHRIRFVGRIVPVQTSVEPTMLAPTAAQHTRFGNVRPAVGSAGGQVTYLEPGDTLNLLFDVPALAAGKVRDLFLVTRGVYTAIAPTGAGEAAIIVATPLKFDLGLARPNPSTGRTTIDYSLARQTAARMRIYNVAGRLVRTLVNGEQKAGPHEVVWDGRSDSGASAGAGVYFYRLEAAEWSSEKKLIILQR